MFDPANDKLKGGDSNFNIDANVGGNTVRGKFNYAYLDGSGTVEGNINDVSVHGNFYGEDKDTAIVGIFVGINEKYYEE